MDFTNADITKSGKRIKEERKRRKITQERLAETINYASRNELSACENGKRFLKEESYIKLSNEWDLRIEYLLGIDDFPTNESFFIGIKEKDNSDLTKSIQYLETIGFRIKPYISCHLSIVILYRNIDVLKECISNESLEKIMNKYDFSLNGKDFSIKYFSAYETVELKRLPNNPDFSLSDSVGKKKTHTNMKMDALPFGGNYVHDFETTHSNLEYFLGYKLYLNDNYIRELSIGALQRMFKSMDNIVLITLKELLYINN